MNRKDIDELEIYQMGMEIGQVTFNLVKDWPALHKNTIGHQIIRSADSIAANISEGYGRYHYKEQRHFCYIARGSLYETNTWLVKASMRIESNKNQIEELLKLVHILIKKLNAYIKYVERQKDRKPQ